MRTITRRTAPLMVKAGYLWIRPEPAPAARPLPARLRAALDRMGEPRALCGRTSCPDAAAHGCTATSCPVVRLPQPGPGWK